MTNPTPAPERGKEPDDQLRALEEKVPSLSGRLDEAVKELNEHQATCPVPEEGAETTVPDELDARVETLERLVSGLIDALGKLYKAPAINDALASEDKDTPLRLRVPTIVLERIAKCTEEALEVAQRASSIAYDDEMLGAALSVLSKDPTLPVTTTTHDPDFERLTALEDATGHAALGQVMNWISERVRGTIGDGRPSLHNLREELGLP